MSTVERIKAQLYSEFLKHAQLTCWASMFLWTYSRKKQIKQNAYSQFFPWLKEYSTTTTKNYQFPYHFQFPIWNLKHLRGEMLLKFALLSFVAIHFICNVQSQKYKQTFKNDGHRTHPVTCFNETLHHDRIGHPNQTVSGCASCEVDHFPFLFTSIFSILNLFCFSFVNLKISKPIEWLKKFTHVHPPCTDKPVIKWKLWHHLNIYSCNLAFAKLIGFQNSMFFLCSFFLLFFFNFVKDVTVENHWNQLLLNTWNSQKSQEKMKNKFHAFHKMDQKLEQIVSVAK